MHSLSNPQSTDNPGTLLIPPQNAAPLTLASPFTSKTYLRGHGTLHQNSLNDPDTNACGYKGLGGRPRGPSSYQRRPPQQGPAAAPERRLPSAQQAGTIFDGVEELLEAERTTSAFGESVAAGAGGATIGEDLFRFREKEALASTERRREVERRRRGPAGGGRGGGSGAGSAGGSGKSAVKVELATQLGVPATSSYEEVRRRKVVLFHRHAVGFGYLLLYDFDFSGLLLVTNGG